MYKFVVKSRQIIITVHDRYINHVLDRRIRKDAQKVPLLDTLREYLLKIY